MTDLSLLIRGSMTLPSRHIQDRLIPALEALRANALAMETKHRRAIDQASPAYRDSVANLLHYLALRQSDVGDVQRDLAVLGLSRLGRSESHVLSSMDAVLFALHRLARIKAPVRGRSPTSIDVRGGARRLDEHTHELLGRPPAKRQTRIMVTMPSEAAERPELASELLAAGMDIMRLNCAHDGPEEWLAMIRHLREAEKATGRACKIYADLQGPKLRTGVIQAAGRVVEFGPRRDLWGSVVQAARLLVVARGAPEPEAASADAVLPIDPELLRQVRAGDELELQDSRGSYRTLTFLCEEEGAWLAQAAVHIYVRDGARCILIRDDRPLAEGKVGPLPEVVLPLLLRAGDRLHVTTEDEIGCPARYSERGKLIEPARIPCTLPEVFDAARAGQSIWFDDGKIGGVIESVDGRRLTVEVTHAGLRGSKLRAEKGINLPETELKVPALSAKDLADLRFVAPHVDSVGLSFVRRPRDVLDLENELTALNSQHIGVVLKIENRQAFENLPRLLLTALRSPPVGVMVARGDLAVEVGFERLAELQEEILSLCEAAHVPVIWATQVLENMAKKGLPSRAEVSDAAMSARAECVMLNKGPHIVETVKLLNGLLERMSGHRTKRRPMLRRLAVPDLPGKADGEDD
jgi:pyruvate kinase